MKKEILLLTFVLVGLLVSPVTTSAAQAKKPVLIIGSVFVPPAVKELAAGDNRARDLDQLVQTLDSEFQNQIVATRKFEVRAAKQAWAQLSQNQEFENSGNVDSATAARMGELTGASLMAIPTINEFIYAKETRKFSGVGKSVDITVLRVRCILNVYDTTKGTIKGTARFVKNEQNNNLRAGLGSSLSKQVIGNIAEALSGQMSNRLVDVEFPARVVIALGTTVGFNRGDQAGVKIGDIWEVYATQVEEVEGEKLEIEIPVGEIKIDRITPKVSYGKVQGENLGIAKNCVVRKKQQVPETSTPNSSGGGSTTKPPSSGGSLRDRLRDRLKK